MTWISVKDKLPDKGDTVLVWGKCNDLMGYSIAYYLDGFKFYFDRITPVEVERWISIKSIQE